jgi:hypothetical protein
VVEYEIDGAALARPPRAVERNDSPLRGLNLTDALGKRRCKRVNAEPVFRRI